MYGGKGSVDGFDCKQSGDGQVSNQVWTIQPVAPETSDAGESEGNASTVQFVWSADPTKCIVYQALPPGPPSPPPRGTPLAFDPTGHTDRVYDGIGGLSNSDAMLLRDYPEA